MITGRRRRQNAETVTFFSISESLALVEREGRSPISWHFSRRRVSCLRRNGESGGSAASRWASCLRDWGLC
jgi:hypothetical protein